MREQADIELLGGVDQAIDGAADEPQRPVLQAVPDEQLRDAVLTGKRQNGVDEVIPLKHINLGPV